MPTKTEILKALSDEKAILLAMQSKDISIQEQANIFFQERELFRIKIAEIIIDLDLDDDEINTLLNYFNSSNPPNTTNYITGIEELESKIAEEFSYDKTKKAQEAFYKKHKLISLDNFVGKFTNKISSIYNSIKHFFRQKPKVNEILAGNSHSSPLNKSQISNSTSNIHEQLNMSSLGKRRVATPAPITNFINSGRRFEYVKNIVEFSEEAWTKFKEELPSQANTLVYDNLYALRKIYQETQAKVSTKLDFAIFLEEMGKSTQHQKNLESICDYITNSCAIHAISNLNAYLNLYESNQPAPKY
ncbi:MAG: hypothetical protein HRT87_10100 [Legionellales bacterium]|nr:hypothetical protein [Legionellales bacterium]